MRYLVFFLLSFICQFANAGLFTEPKMPTVSATSNNFLTAISSSGSVTVAQPSFTNLSGTLSFAQAGSLGINQVFPQSGASSFMLRDSSQNVAVNSVDTTMGSLASNVNVTLTAGSMGQISYTGASSATVTLPSATTLNQGRQFAFWWGGSNTLTVNDNGGNTIDSLTGTGAWGTYTLTNNATTNGVWALRNVPRVSATNIVNTLVSRNGNGNSGFNGWAVTYGSVASSNGTTTLATTDPNYQLITGTLAHAFLMPANNGGGMLQGETYVFNNRSTGNVTINSKGTVAIKVAEPGSTTTLRLNTTGADTSAGPWDVNYVVDGTQTVLHGGTGVTTFSTNSVLLGGGTTIGTVAAGTATGQTLQWQGSGTAPVWATNTASIGHQGTLTTFTAGTGTLATASDSSASTIYYVECIAGGGGAGGSSAAAAGGCSGGGGAGAWAAGTLTGIAASTNIVFNIGAGGSAGSSTPTSGGSGGSTGIASKGLNLAGGSGTASYTTAAAQYGASGGGVTASPGGWNSSTGQTGGGCVLSRMGGLGAGSQLGAGGSGGVSGINGAGSSGQGYGTGGGGAVDQNGGGGGGGGGFCRVIQLTP